jgi:hypothetical protein
VIVAVVGVQVLPRQATSVTVAYLESKTPGCPGVTSKLSRIAHRQPAWDYMAGILTPICASAAGTPPSAGDSTCI